MLRKTRNNRTQSSVGNAEKRRKNVKGVYEALDTAAIRGKRVLLVDDIVTTGATLSECASVLKKAGAKQIAAATVARKKD
jgi:predicted amidophosphoribosyltransferase